MLMANDRRAADPHIIPDRKGSLFPDDEVAGLLASDHIIASSVLEMKSVADRQAAIQAQLQYRQPV
jgi:hypothetical protein